MAARLAEKGVQMIDAPVSGGPHGANTGTIAIMVGAPPDLFAKVKPIFETISPTFSTPAMSAPATSSSSSTT